MGRFIRISRLPALPLAAVLIFAFAAVSCASSTGRGQSMGKASSTSLSKSTDRNAASSTGREGLVRKVATFPSEGSHTGVAGAFIGNIGDVIFIAGGSDFPDRRPWEGGIKRYYDDIYLLTQNDAGYSCTKVETKLPEPIGNGCTATLGETIYCFGGNNNLHSSEAVYSISLVDGMVRVDYSAALPTGFIPAAAAAIGEDIYVHGTDTHVNRLYRFTPSTGEWQVLPGCPDRLLSEGSNLVLCLNGEEEALYLIGGRGTDAEGLYISSKTWEYLPSRRTWSRKSDVSSDGSPMLMMYAAAVRYGTGMIVLMGGDDGVEFLRRDKLDRLIRTCSDPGIKADLQQQLTSAFVSHPGFSRKILCYSPASDSWVLLAETEKPLPAVTSAVRCGDKFIIPCGEASPGVRENGIYEVTFP